MPFFVAAIGATLLTGVGVTLVGSAAVVASLIVGSVALGVVTYAATRPSRLKDNSSTGASSHQLAVRSTTEPRKIVYGEALVSGPIAYLNASGPDNRLLFTVIALTGHESQSIQGVYLDTKFVPVADISTLASAGDGSVTADTNSHGYGPINTTPVLYIREHLGTAAQTVDSMLDTYFTDIGANHRMRGCTYAVVRMDKLNGVDSTWLNGMPANLSFLVRGKKVYDPRLDGTFSGTWGVGVGAHRVATPSTWAYSSNPALCLADYLIDSDLGAGFASARVDYDSVALSADQCDVLSAIPGAATQTRFTCNGSLATSDTHRDNIEKILSSMAGTLRYYNGQWRIKAGTYPSTDFTLDQSHLIGPVKYRDGPEKGERYNAVRGVYFDPSRLYKENQYLTVSDTTLQSARDTSLVLYKDLDLPMTNHEYMAQRIAYRALNQAAQTGICVFPTGYNGLNIAPGDTGTVTLSELGWTSKVFRCVGLRHVDMVGVELILKEDASTAYTDPLAASYGTRTGATATFPLTPATVIGVIVDPLFTQPINSSWLVEAGSGVSIVSGGGEGGGNALELTNAAAVTQAARNDFRFNTSVGEVISCEFRVKKTTNVASAAVRFSYYRSDTMASLGTVDQTLSMASTGTYYTLSLRQRTPTTYTLAAGVFIVCDIQVRMVPSGAGTATVTFSSISATRSGTVGTDEIAASAATEVYNDYNDFAGAASGTGIVTQRSFSITPPSDCVVTMSGYATADNVLADSAHYLYWDVNGSTKWTAPATSTAKQNFGYETSFNATGGVSLTFSLKTNVPAFDPNIHLYISEIVIAQVKR